MEAINGSKKWSKLELSTMKTHTHQVVGICNIWDCDFLLLFSTFKYKTCIENDSLLLLFSAISARVCFYPHVPQ